MWCICCLDQPNANNYQVTNNDVVTIVPRRKREQDTGVREYSDTFISIRQSTVSDFVDEIDLTPAPPSHDYSNVDMTEKELASKNSTRSPKKQRPTKPIPNRPKPGSTRISPTQTNGSFSPPLPPLPPLPSTPPSMQKHKRNDSPIHSRQGDGQSAANSFQVPKPPARSTVGSPSHPKRPSRDGIKAMIAPKVPTPYDIPYQLKTKPIPPTKKKPTIVLSKTKAGAYDETSEVMVPKKEKPKKPSREGILVAENGNAEGDDPLYDLPEENVYNTAEAVYDEKGCNIAEGTGSSPKFDDGIYMSSGNGGGGGGGIGSQGERLTV